MIEREREVQLFKLDMVYLLKKRVKHGVTYVK